MSLLGRFFIPCYFGNEIQYEYGESLRDAYKIDWLDATENDKRSFLILQENLKSSFQLEGGKTVPINLATFVRIIKSAYSMYAVLSHINN